MNAFDHELVERYLAGQLSGDELREFENRLVEDADLRKGLEQYREVQDVLQRDLHPDERQQAFFNTLQHFRESGSEQSARRKQIIPRYVISAAAMAAIIAGILFLSPWQKDLYHQYVSIEMVSPAERGDNQNDVLAQAAELFNDKEFAAAVPLLGQALAQDPGNAYARYYRGIALLEANQVAEARTDLQQVSGGSSLFKYDAMFFMALTYLKQKDYTNTRLWLQKIPEVAGNYEKAQKLLHDL